MTKTSSLSRCASARTSPTATRATSLRRLPIFRTATAGSGRRRAPAIGTTRCRSMRTSIALPRWPPTSRRFPFAKRSCRGADGGRPLERPHMVCEPTPTVLNLAINRVQHTFQNRHGGIDARSLNGAFLSGFAMDLRPYLGATFSSCHVEVEAPLVPDGRVPPSGQTAPSSRGWCPQHDGEAASPDENGVSW